jgi:hypothetical protein
LYPENYIGRSFSYRDIRTKLVSHLHEAYKVKPSTD